MDTPDRSEGALTPWSPSPLAPHVPAAAWDGGHDGPPPKAFNTRLLLRALRRHWWQILAIWFVVSSGLVYLAYTKIRPTYDAISWLEVEPAARSLITTINQAGGDAFAPYLETQVLLVTSPDVISEAISNKAIAAMPRIRDSLDPELDLRKEIAVLPQRGTHVIQVKMSGENSREVADIVNAVVKSYMRKAETWTAQEVKAQMDTLEKLRLVYKNTDTELKLKLRVKLKEAGEAEGGRGGKDDKESEARNGQLQVSRDQFRQYKMRLAEIVIERARQEATVNFLREELNNHPSAAAAAAAAVAAASPEEREARIVEEFRGLPAVLTLQDEIDKAQAKLDRVKKTLSPGRPDPAYSAAKKRVDDLVDRHAGLWEKAYPVLARKAAQPTGAAATDAATANAEAELHHALLALKSLEVQAKLLDKQIQSVQVEVTDAYKHMADIRFLEDDVKYNDDLLTTVKRNLEQLQYEANNGTRIKLIAIAKQTSMPATNNRYKLMAAAPVLVLLLAAGLFVLLEAKSGRVADPDDLSARLRLGVLGVVPPLPSLQPSRSLSFRGARDEKRRVEEFVQSLDHLRVTLCAPKPGKSHRRCVLITSACGGEGKTTLAAQLAGRCANAGLMTLLIDADLRRPSLGELLEVPEGPGLVDVLSGEASPEAAMVVIGNAGGFHLLPAGTMGQDPSRLLHGDRLGLLLAQFRETFEMVIIDAPPVLAVPDALLLGRWTDGAVLAVRHDTSRFPLVERANKRLASVGVPVLGAVVNGVRTVDSNYGSYRYTPYAAAGAPDPAADHPLD